MKCPNVSRGLQASIAAVLLSATLAGCNSKSAERTAGSNEHAAESQPAMTAPPGAPERSPSVAATGATPSDVALAGKVESALAAETALHGSAIAVKADDGVVTLTGSTKDPELRSMAAQVALSVTGVRSVRNELTLSTDV